MSGMCFFCGFVVWIYVMLIVEQTASEASAVKQKSKTKKAASF